MATNVIGAIGFADYPPTLGVSNLARNRSLFFIPDTPEERLAREHRCTECNAPAHASCQKIYWFGMEPRTIPRKFHSRRLVDAKRVAQRRERFNAAAER